jgi:hypothetical protein
MPHLDFRRNVTLVGFMCIYLRALPRCKAFGWLIIKERYHSFIYFLHLMNIYGR